MLNSGINVRKLYEESIMNEVWKVGDKVELRPDSEWASKYPSNPVGVVGVVDEVRRAWPLDVHVQWPGGQNSYASKDLLPAKSERQELSDALDLCNRYNVSTPLDGTSHYNYIAGQTGPFTNEQVLDTIFPPAKTAEQLEIEEVEGKLRVLADQLAKLKER